MSANTNTHNLQRVLRIRDGMAVTIGMIIGAGILRTPGLIAGYLGDPWLILGLWFFGGVVVALSTLVLAEMSAALPEAGGNTCMLATPGVTRWALSPAGQNF